MNINIRIGNYPTEIDKDSLNKTLKKTIEEAIIEHLSLYDVIRTIVIVDVLFDKKYGEGKIVKNPRFS